MKTVKTAFGVGSFFAAKMSPFGLRKNLLSFLSHHEGDNLRDALDTALNDGATGRKR